MVLIVSREHTYLDAASKNLRIALEYLDIADERISQAFGGDDPTYPYPDSVGAKGWDYIDAIRIAQREIGHRLNTWDNGHFWEGN
jgi:hypothetical protein